jgi:uncharacterized protein (DUF849 family)
VSELGPQAGPEQFAAYAMQEGGFTTPHNEAWRLLYDACRALQYGWGPELRSQVRNTLDWLKQHPEAAALGERDYWRLIDDYPNWDMACINYLAQTDEGEPMTTPPPADHTLDYALAQLGFEIDLEPLDTMLAIYGLLADEMELRLEELVIDAQRAANAKTAEQIKQVIEHNDYALSELTAGESDVT